MTLTLLFIKGVVVAVPLTFIFTYICNKLK